MLSIINIKYERVTLIMLHDIFTIMDKYYHYYSTNKCNQSLHSLQIFLSIIILTMFYSYQYKSV